MRTVRCSGRLGGGGGADLPREGGLPRSVYTPLWTERRLWKHYLSATTVADGENVFLHCGSLSKICGGDKAVDYMTIVRRTVSGENPVSQAFFQT